MQTKSRWPTFVVPEGAFLPLSGVSFPLLAEVTPAPLPDGLDCAPLALLLAAAVVGSRSRVFCTLPIPFCLLPDSGVRGRL